MAFVQNHGYNKSTTLYGISRKSSLNRHKYNYSFYFLNQADAKDVLHYLQLKNPQDSFKIVKTKYEDVFADMIKQQQIEANKNMFDFSSENKCHVIKMLNPRIFSSAIEFYRSTKAYPNLEK